MDSTDLTICIYRTTYDAGPMKRYRLEIESGFGRESVSSRGRVLLLFNRAQNYANSNSNRGGGEYFTFLLLVRLSFTMSTVSCLHHHDFSNPFNSIFPFISRSTSASNFSYADFITSTIFISCSSVTLYGGLKIA